MGILTEGAIVSEVRGSVGSRTFSKNAYGPYVKNKLIQTNPDTAKQRARRNRFKLAVQAWQGFTDANRRLWNDWAKANPVRNSLGKQVVLSGFNMYISAYMNKLTVGTLGLPIVFSKKRIPATTRGAVFAMGAPLMWQFFWVNGNADFHAAMYIAPQRSVSKGFVNPSELKLSGYQPADGGFQFEIESINNNMGFPTFTISEGLFSPVGIKIIDIYSGLGSPLYVSKIQSVNNGFIH